MGRTVLFDPTFHYAIQVIPLLHNHNTLNIWNSNYYYNFYLIHYLQHIMTYLWYDVWV